MTIDSLRQIAIERQQMGAQQMALQLGQLGGLGAGFTRTIQPTLREEMQLEINYHLKDWDK